MNLNINGIQDSQNLNGIKITTNYYKKKKIIQHRFVKSSYINGQNWDVKKYYCDFN